jgi:23S rRNA (guanosine2251-2'-O)-methyltransferase
MNNVRNTVRADLNGKMCDSNKAENDAMCRLTSENCDYTVKLPIARTVESLNVSNACAIALYEWSRIHLK